MTALRKIIDVNTGRLIITCSSSLLHTHDLSEGIRTTNFAIPGTFTEVAMNTTGVETNPLIVEHDTTNTEIITGHPTGLYRVHMDAQIEALDDEEDFRLEIRANGTAIWEEMITAPGDDDGSSMPISRTKYYTAATADTDFTVAWEQVSGSGDFVVVEFKLTVEKVD